MSAEPTPETAIALPSAAATGRTARRIPRLGFLGVGWIGLSRLRAIEESGAAEVAMIADTSAEMRTAAREVAPDAEVADSYEALLHTPLDGVVIATPSALHAEQSIAALERGLAVFCQKPLGRNALEVREVVEAARRADRLLGIDLSYRHAAAFAMARQIVASGSIGEVFAADLTFHNAYGPDKPWFFDPALSGGGCLMDLGIHLVDMGLWTLDFPGVDRVEARLFTGGRPICERSGVEDYASVHFDTRSGATLRLACSWKLPAGCDAVIDATFYGTRGGVRVRNVDGSFYDFVAERFDGTTREVLIEPPDAWGGRAAQAWAERLAIDPSFDGAATELIAVARVLDRAYAAGGRQEAL